jgi:hypothetical protein
MADEVKFNVMVTEADGEYRTGYVDADQALGGSFDNFTAVLTSPNGLVKRRVGIDDNGNLVLLPLDTPPVLTLGLVDATSVALTWTDPTTTESGFVVERADDVLFTLNVVTVTATGMGTTSYTDTNVIGDAIYYYRVKAVVGSVDLTLPSNIIAAHVPAVAVDPLLAVQRRNRSMYSKVAMFAPMDETSGTATAGQRNKRVRGKVDGIFTKRLEEDQAIDPLTLFYVPRLVNQVTAHGTFLNLNSFVLPFYEARWDTPKIHVSDSPPGSQMDLDDTPYKWGTGVNSPWEPGYRSSDAEVGWYDETAITHGYRDRSMVVIDPTNDTLWEYYQVYRKGLDRENNPHDYPNVTAEFGGRMPNMKDFNGIWPSGPGGSTGFGLSGTSVAYGVTFVRLEEIQAGVIPHAIPFAVSIGTSQHRLPATRGDQTGGTDDVPEGARFRFAYDFDVDAYAATHDVSPLEKMFLQAIRTYGLVVSDASSGVVSFAIEDLRPSPSYRNNLDPWWQYLVSSTQQAFTGSAATNTITSTAHGMLSAHKRKVIIDSGFTGGSGLGSAPTYYFAGNCTTNTFQLFTNFSQTILAPIGSDASGTFRKVQESYELFDTSRFPWSSLLLLPPVAAF